MKRRQKLVQTKSDGLAPWEVLVEELRLSGITPESPDYHDEEVEIVVQRLVSQFKQEASA